MINLRGINKKIYVQEKQMNLNIETCKYFIYYQMYCKKLNLFTTNTSQIISYGRIINASIESHRIYDNTVRKERKILENDGNMQQKKKWLPKRESHSEPSKAKFSVTSRSC